MGTGLLASPVFSRAAEKPVKRKAGYYYLVPKADTSRVAEVKKASLEKGAKVRLHARGTAASRVWKLEPAGGRKFRLKNVNSGLYLGVSTARAKAGKPLVQKEYKKKDKTIVFQALSAGGKYDYIKCTANGQYLYVAESQIQGNVRGASAAKAWKFKWEKTSCPASSMRARDYTYPVSLRPGEAFSLAGTVTSRYAMTQLRAQVVDVSGKAVLSKKVFPRSLSYELRGVDASMKFGTLPVGNYQYQVKVKDSRGTEKMVISKAFGVGVPATDDSVMLEYRPELIGQVGCQSEGTALEKKACASYALAYCRAILDGTAPSPHDFWVSGTDVDCVWSRGGYKTVSFASEEEVLQAAYLQLRAGLPCILHVTGNTAQHWVTLVGYTGVSASSGNTGDSAGAACSIPWSVSRFTAIDPWDGGVFTVSDRYQVKTTFRLAIRA